MAAYYAKESNYIDFLGKKFFIFFLVGIAFFLAFGFRIAQVAQYNPELVLLILFIALGIFLIVANKYVIKSKKLSFGKLGEWNVKEELLKLPDEYHVFSNVVVGKGDIDFVVIGPSGVYAIEVKGHSGRIAFDGSRLTKNGWSLDKDFIGQAHYEAMDLKKFLEDHGQKIYVKSVLVFSSSRAFIKVEAAPIREVSVMHIDSMLKFINYNPSLDPGQVARLVEILANTYEKK
jgi:hypothetical protein